MLRFTVYDRTGHDWSVSQAYLFGPDEVPVAGDVRLDGGIIRCEKPSAESAGLALQARVEMPGGESLGMLMLRTCLLPEREEPYLLTLELARHRIMLVLNKLEEWALFDLPPDHPILAQLDQAREEFTGALVALCHRTSHNGVVAPDEASVKAADAAAGRALALALDASERLALLHAEQQLAGRLDGSIFADAQARADSITADRVMPEGSAKAPDSVGIVLPGPPQVGCAIDPASFSEPLAKAAAGASDFVLMPMRWVDMEPTEGKYAFAKTDKWIEWAVRTAKLPVAAGPLIDFREVSTPEWLYIWEHDYETLRELVYEHIKTIVTRYRRTIARWTVCSGLHVNEAFALSVEKMMDLTRMCALLVKKLHPAAKVQLEIAQPWGEYFARNKRSMPPRMYADMVTQAGIAVDAFALRVQMSQPVPGRAARDLMAIADLLDRYAELDKPISITAIGVPSQALQAPQAESAAMEAGFWRTPSSPETQAKWLRQAMAVMLSKPYVHSVCWQALYDVPGADMPSGGLLTESGMPKPAAAALAEVKRSVQPRPAARP